MGVLRLCLLACCLAACYGVDVSAADAAALLLPMAVMHGCKDLVEIVQALAVAGLEASALAMLAYVRIRISEKKRTHQEHHAATAPEEARPHRHPYRRHRPKNRRVEHLNWQQRVLDHLPPREFRNSYGLSREIFESLVDVIRDDVTDSRKDPRCMSAEVKLAMTLRWLRGGSYLDILALYGCSKQTFYRVVYRVMVAINKHHTLPLVNAIKEMHATGSSSTLARIAAGFAAYTDGIIAYCIGAIDGVQVAIVKPSRRACPNPTAYYNRKGYFALNVQAIADSTGRITWASIRTPGAVNDANAFELSALFDLVARLGLAAYHFVGDSAYTNSETMLVPFPAASAPAGSANDAFNFYQSSTRIAVERSFGMIERRWGILWRRLEVRLAAVPLVLMTIFILHNLCMDAAVPLPDMGAHRPLDRDARGPVGRPAADATTLRARIVQALVRGGFQRPPLPGGVVRRDE